MTDITEQLRQSLHRGADGLPYGPDLTTGAMARARVIRRRRRTITVAAVVAVVAIGVPTGLQIGDSVTRTEPPVATEQTEPSDPTGPTAVQLDLAELPEGGLPDIPFRWGDAYWFGTGAHDLGGMDPIQLAAWDGGGVITVSQQDSLNVYVTSLDDRPALIDKDIVSSATSPDGRWLAYVADGFLNVRDAENTGIDATSVTFEVPRSTEVIEVTDDGQVLLTTEQGDSLLYDGTDVQPLDVADVTAWSQTAGLYAQITEVTDRLVERSAVLTDEGAVLWRSGEWMVDQFSADGRWAYALPSYRSGYGLVQVAVLDARTGEVVRIMRFGSGDEFGGVIRDATWESDNSLLLQVESDPSGNTPAHAALIRLDVATGEADVATPVQDVQTADGESPYLLGG